ncbi:hypothetical protein PCORN_04607 [Listeria cornellensis FSL F6-0969]|uniref:Uncharacterized protein n=1 Tax=Listeria cornellensis FSL F6-0969 TaxID=1265820 RepID=W7C3D1_9LIST|nr:hypothetical protein PCORN_04607 [Listeria cornellensis FSL F6-0969]
MEIVPVGLFGLQSQMIFVRGLTALAMAVRSDFPVVSSTGMRCVLAPSIVACREYWEKVGAASMMLSPGSRMAREMIWITSSRPEPSKILSVGTP